MSKVRIPVEQLPPPNKNGDHILQFRVISEDRNNISAWSNLYIVKSIGQYRPYESDVTMVIGTNTIDVSWDTPIIYNSSSALPSASISHNHTQNFKKHDTDIFVKWDNGDFEYHDRVNLDSTSILIQNTSASVRVVGLVATHGIPQRNEIESSSEFSASVQATLNAGFNSRIQGYLDEAIPLFKVFDTGTQLL